MNQEILYVDRAARILEANLTPRYRELNKLQAYVAGTQYEGKPHWLTEDDVPLLERAPCVIEPVAENAIESFVDLIFGEEHFPAISSAPDENDEAFDPRFGLDEDDSKVVDRFLQHIAKQCELQEVSRHALARAMGERSVAAIVCVRDGKLAIDLEHSKCCVPTFDEKRPALLRSLEIRYPYTERYFDDAHKRWAMRCMLYRRVIDERADTTFEPIEAHESGEEPGAGEWRIKTEVVHNFGFCPVVWWQYRKREASQQTGPDGVAIHERLLDEIDALNRSHSQRHRASLSCGDPQTVETGVDDDVTPAPAGRLPNPMKSYPGESPAVREANARWQTGQAGNVNVRRKGPGIVWRYPSKDSKVEYLTLDPEALKVIDDEISRLHQLLSEAMSWVRADPTTIAGESKRGVSLSQVSGKALAWMYKRQTMQCDSIRSDAWSNWISPIVNLLFRVALAYAADKARGALYLPGLDKAAAILKRFVQPVSAGRNEQGVDVTADTWFSPMLNPSWPPYFAPTEEDQARVSKQAIDDHEAGLITKRTAVKRIAEFYDDIENVDQYIESLEEEARENMARAHEMGLGNESDGDEQDGDEADDPGGVGTGAGENAPPKRKGGRGARPASGDQAQATAS